jgi:hypothetical protein
MSGTAPFPEELEVAGAFSHLLVSAQELQLQPTVAAALNASLFTGETAMADSYSQADPMVRIDERK